MVASRRPSLSAWPTAMPVVAVVALALTWGRHLGPLPVTLVALVLAGAVLAAVHHAEVVAHRVGEPFGSLVLAVAVTVIEVALIVTLMVSGGPEHRVAGPRHRVRRRDDHRQRHRRPLAAGRRAAVRRHAVQRGGHRRGAGHGRVARHAESGAADLHHQPQPGPEFYAGPADLRGAGLAGPLRRVRHDADRPPPRLLPAGHRAEGGDVDRRTEARTTPTRRPAGRR